MSKVLIAGVGMTPFTKPGASPSYAELGERAAREALADAGLDYADVQQVYAGYVYGLTTCGQAALHPLGATGIPVINVNNACASGSTALFLARQLVESGAADCVMALGFEEMRPGALSDAVPGLRSPLERFNQHLDAITGHSDEPPALRFFGAAGAELQARYGIKDETFAKVTVKARRHAVHNERAIFRTPVTVEEVLSSPKLCGPMTRLQACPPTCGGAAAIVVSQEFATRRGLNSTVAIRAQAMASDLPSTLGQRSGVKLLGEDVVKLAAGRVYETAGIGPQDLDVAEIHDCFTSNELILNTALGFAPEGETEAFVQDEQNTYGGAIVVNPSGGLLSKGHPLGATGLAQCAELVWQLRGQAGRRQVENARLALAQNFGLGSACVVTLFERST
jgi:acetyl-CoA acetyltransferase